MENSEVKICNLLSYIEYIVSKYKNRTLFFVQKDNGVEYVSYKKFGENVERWKNFFISNNLKKKNVVLSGILSCEWVYAFFGIICSGNSVVLSESSGDNAIADGIRVDIIVDIQKGENYSYCEIPNNIADSNCCGGQWNKWNTLSEEIALIVPTSGTEGHIKWVYLTHDNLVSDLLHIIEIFGQSFGFSDRLYSFLPQYHMYEIMVGFIVTPFYGAQIFIDESSSKNYIKALLDFKPTVILAVPEIAKTLLSINSKNIIENMNAIVCGGAPIEQNVIEKYKKMGVAFFFGYGATECSPIITCNTDFSDCGNSVGKISISQYCKITIVDGEIIVSGKIVSPGYFEAKRGYVPLNNIFNSGDLGECDDQNNLYIIGRKKNLIIMGNGINISPELIEKELCECTKIDIAIVSEMWDERVEKSVIGARIKPIATEDIEDAQRSISDYIKHYNREKPYYMRIQKIIYIDEATIQKNSMRKIMR